MRRVLAALCAATLFVAACGDGNDSPATTVATTSSSVTTTTPDASTTSEAVTTTTVAPPAYGGVVAIGDDQEPPTLNPFVPGGDNLIVSIIGQAHLAGAYDIDATTLELIPELLTELPSVGNGGVALNEDGTMTVRYQIRDEAVWSDGVPISGYDFEFTLGVMLNPVEGGVEVPYDVVATEPGDKTFEFTLASPTANYETIFPVIVPEHVVADSDMAEDWNAEMWPAAGPFVFSEWQRGEYIRLVRNEKYWKDDPETGMRLPYLDAVEFHFMPETESLVYSFTQRELDVIQPPPSREIIDRLRELEPAGADVQVRAGPVWEHLNFQYGPNNRNPESLNQYLSFRQAIAYAIDKEVAAPMVGWQPITSMLDPWGGEGPWAQYSYDPDRATALLAEACEAAGRDCAIDQPKIIFSTTSNADARPRLADYLKTSLADLGIEVELQLEDSQLYFGDTLNEGTWDVGWWAWIASPGAAGFVALLEVVDPDSVPPDGLNFYRWGTWDSSVNDEAVTRFRDILAIVRQTVDPDELISLAKAAEQILADNAVLIPVASRSVVGAVWADKLAGYVMNPTQASHTWNVEFWRRLDL